MRRAVEQQIMEVVNRADLPLNMKLAWYGFIFFYDTFFVYWAGNQYGYKLANKQITRYWPNYNLIREKSHCKLSYGEEDSEAREELESRGEGSGANKTTESNNTQGSSHHVDNGSSSESSTRSDEDKRSVASPDLTTAKSSPPAPVSLAKKIRSAKANTNKNAGPMAKKAGIRKRAPKRILKKTSAYDSDEK